MNPYIIDMSKYDFIKELGSIGDFLGDIKIRWYSFLILLGALIAILMFRSEGKRFGIDKEFLFNLAFWTIIVGFIGARVYYVLFNLNLYKDNIWSMFKIWEGGLAIHGGIIAGIIVMYAYCKKYNMRFTRITDFAVPGLLIAQAIGRWGNFFNGEAHGAPTSLEHLQNLHLPEFIIEGMNISGIYYEPTFLYESLLCLIGFIAILIIRRLKYVKVGMPTCFYLMYYGVIRFFIESMRTDSLMLGGFRAAQIVSVIMFIVGLLMTMILSRKGRFEDLYNNIDEQSIRF